MTEKYVYEVWPGRNRFLCCGWVMIGPKEDLPVLRRPELGQLLRVESVAGAADSVLPADVGVLLGNHSGPADIVAIFDNINANLSDSHVYHGAWDNPSAAGTGAAVDQQALGD